MQIFLCQTTVGKIATNWRITKFLNFGSQKNVILKTFGTAKNSRLQNKCKVAIMTSMQNPSKEILGFS